MSDWQGPNHPSEHDITNAAVGEIFVVKHEDELVAELIYLS